MHYFSIYLSWKNDTKLHLMLLNLVWNIKFQVQKCESNGPAGKKLANSHNSQKPLLTPANSGNSMFFSVSISNIHPIIQLDTEFTTIFEFLTFTCWTSNFSRWTCHFLLTHLFHKNKVWQKIHTVSKRGNLNAMSRYPPKM